MKCCIGFIIYLLDNMHKTIKTQRLRTVYIDKLIAQRSLLKVN